MLDLIFIPISYDSIHFILTMVIKRKYYQHRCLLIQCIFWLRFWWRSTCWPQQAQIAEESALYSGKEKASGSSVIGVIALSSTACRMKKQLLLIPLKSCDYMQCVIRFPSDVYMYIHQTMFSSYVIKLYIHLYVYIHVYIHMYIYSFFSILHWIQTS